MTEIYKIVFLGLDFAGKTSILKILEGSYSGLDQIKPTLGTKRTAWEILGFKIMNWDLGGQQQYREEYLKNYEQILQDTNLLIFVIDVQDDHRFNEAGAYFDDMLHALDHLKIKCPVVLCLHKVDPDIVENAPIIKNLNWITNLFSDYSQKHDVEIKVFITSIFDRKSLVEMFSYGIGKLMPLGILSQILDEFRLKTEQLGTVGTILFDKNFFVVGNTFPDLKTKKACYKTINAFTTLMRDFKGVYDDRQVSFDLNISNGENYKFQLEKITELAGPYYLLIMGSQSLKSKEIFSIFHKIFVTKIEKGLHELIKTID
ncbi:MAG: hypothetical protein HWN66_08230 [Candidatus Helarchaeota archaeon]|nr:hypothetical protein [Candidatus Helarchaeota archaeon]